MIIASIYPCPFDVQDRHDMNAAIIKDEVIYAYEEAKLTTTKLEGTVKFPERSLMMGCKELNILPSEIDIWVFPMPSKPVDLNDQFLFFSWIFKAYKGNFDDFEQWYKEHVYFIEHQLSHAALAVLASDFEECAFLCQDGGGDFGDPRDLIFGEFKNGEFHIIDSHFGLKNICSFHAFITDSIGFSGGDNGKTSGLAAYGKVQNQLLQKISPLITIEENGIIFERERYGRTEVILSKINPSEYNRYKIFNQYPSNTNILRMSLEYFPQDIAATGEYILQKVFLEFLNKIKKKTSMENIVFSGGLFQNVALNNKILESGLFKKIFIPMSPSDAGLSLGAALYVQNILKKRKKGKMLTPFLGPSFNKNGIRNLLDRFRINYIEVDDIAKVVAQLIADGNIIGWFQGKGEYGPRALGNRSIIADPRNPHSKTRINQLLKKRDWFMPYAPSILKEHLHEWVEIPLESPYMQIAFKVLENKRSLIPAAVHVNGSCRFHVINREDNEKYWMLIEHFREITGIPLILNTSFNRDGIATISTPRQAVEHFLEGCMDYLAIENFLLDFSKNRLVSSYIPLEKDENICLAEDCIKRLKVVFTYGSDEQISKYIRQLSSMIGVKIERNENRLLIEDKSILKLEDTVEILIQKVNDDRNIDLIRKRDIGEIK